MKKLLVVVLTVMLLFVLVGCSSPTVEPSGSTSDESSDSAPSETNKADDQLVIGYLAKNMTVQWMQDMEDAMIELGEKHNFTLLTANAASSPETQMNQLQDFITQGVDGLVILIADEGIAPAVVDKCEEAGVPIVGESIRLIEENDNLVAPCVELSAIDCGSMCSQWIYDNYASLGFDFGDFSQVGFVTITNSTIRNNEERCDGAENKFIELFSSFPRKTCSVPMMLVKPPHIMKQLQSDGRSDYR